MVGPDGEIRALSAAEVADAVGRGTLGAEEVVAAHVAALDDLTPYHALITACPERALDRARAGVSGPLAGVPLVVKDLFDTEGVRTTYGSRIHSGHVPTRTARAVALLEDAGAIVIAKANLHEFAWGTTSQNPHWGAVESPVRPGRVAGGSSGGNAAALAAGVGALGLGTDTAGSLRIPAACCGVVGLKPAHGAIPLEGCLPLSPTYDVAGPMGRTVADCALALGVLAGEPVPAPAIDGLVVGVLDEPPPMSAHDPGAAPTAGEHDLGATVAGLEALGARPVETRIAPPGADLLPIMLREAADAHRDTFPARRDEYGPDTQLKWDLACAVATEAVDAARAELPRWRATVTNAPGRPDLFVSPVLAREVPALDVWEPDVRVGMVGFTRIFSFLGWPAIAVGDVQFSGPDTATVLAAALAWEEAQA